MTRTLIRASFLKFALAITAILTSLVGFCHGDDVLAVVSNNRSYTAFDLRGGLQQASHASFALNFPDAGVKLESALIPFAGPYPSNTTFDSSYPSFNTIAALLANDVDDLIRVDYQLWLPTGLPRSAGVGGSYAPESIMLLKPNYTRGATITSIRLEVNYMTHTTNGNTESVGMNSWWYVIGVPEPSAALLMASGLFGLLACRRRHS